MTEVSYTYPFDPTGRKIENLVKNERHIVSPPDHLDYYFIVPFSGPFFEDGLKVVHYPSGKELIKGKDYVLSYQFNSASKATAKPVYGAISIYNRDISGTLEIEYQSIGGKWIIDESKAAELLSNVVNNPRITTWEQVVELPEKFPVIDHEWDLVDLVGASDLVDVLQDIKDSIANGELDGGAAAAHALKTDNPHEVTKVQVGLGSVDNYPTASVEEGQAGESNVRFTTPLVVAEAIKVQVGEKVDDHIADKGNPHGVTKAQVGLSKVDNFETATIGESVDGSSETLFVTPAGVAAAVESRIGSDVVDHVGATDNPHNVTKGQVGLGDVPNYKVATITQHREGTAQSLFATPAGVTAAIETQIKNLAFAHFQNTDNPHGVTKGQVGLSNVDNYSTATAQDARDGQANNKFMTPEATAEAINYVAIAAIDNHKENENNPHNVTKDQIGLSKVENYSRGDYDARYAQQDGNYALLRARGTTKADVGLGQVANYSVASIEATVSGESEEMYATPAGVRATVDQIALPPIQEHAAKTDNPHNVTKSQVGLGNVVNWKVATVDQAKQNVNNAYSTPSLTKVQIDQIVMPEIETIKENERNFSESVTTSFEDLNWRLDGKHLIDIEEKYAYGIFMGDPAQNESYNLSIDALQAAPDGTFIVAGVGGRIARFNGQDWNSVNSPTTDDILGLGVTGDAWVIVTATKEVYRTTNGGTNWANVTPTGLSGKLSVMGIGQFSSNNFAIITNDSLFHSGDAGVTWTEQTNSNIGEIRDYSRFDKGMIFLATDAGPFIFQPGETIDEVVSGRSNGISSDITFVDILDINHVYFKDSQGDVARYDFAFDTWDSPDIAFNPTLARSDEIDNLFMIVSDGDQIFRSTNKGETWFAYDFDTDSIGYDRAVVSSLGWMFVGPIGETYFSKR